MGKSLASRVSLRHRIKQCDRLVGNEHLQREQILVYGSMTRRVLAGLSKVAIVVDWSELRDDGSMQLLRAAAIVKERAFTVYEEVHPQKMLGSLAVHQAFMTRLRSVLPPACTPVIITDAGFRATWFNMLNHLGYAWIGRVRNTELFQELGANTWVRREALYAQAQLRVRDLGNYLYARANPTSCRIILNKFRRKGRVKKTKFGNRTLSARSKKQAKGQSEPWLLAVSPTLGSMKASQIVQLYAGRMQIEQTFRDLKDYQWGQGLRKSQTRGKERLSVLLLIGALASYALWLIGLTARKAGFNVSYGSRSKAATTLSILNLAKYWINEQLPPHLNKFQLNEAITTLRAMVITYEI
jgi:hypothetical protein